MPRCYDCLSEDVAVEIRMPGGFSRYLCKEDWEAAKQFQAKIVEMLYDSSSP